MSPQDLVERYVQDVARRLPHSMRNDVATELRSLIADGLTERAVGRAPNPQDASDFLIALGSPESFAVRYSAPAPIIDAGDLRMFGKLSVGLVIALGVLALGVISSSPHADNDQWRVIAASVTQDFIDASLKVLGFLLVVFWCVGIVRRHHPHDAAWSPKSLPPARDPDRVSRGAYIAAITAWTIGFLVLMYPVVAFNLMLGAHVPPALSQLFAYDEGFSQTRAPVLWAVVTASLMLIAWVAAEGRWRKPTRQISVALSGIFCLVCAWVIVLGPVFTAPATDQAMKFALAVIAGLTIIDVWQQLRGVAPRGLNAPVGVH